MRDDPEHATWGKLQWLAPTAADVVNQPMSPDERQQIYAHVQRISRVPATEAQWPVAVLRLEDAGDAGCQFRALAALLHNDPGKYRQVRLTVAEHMRDKAEQYSKIARQRGVSWAQYCDRIGVHGRGDRATLRAAANAYECAIQVLSSDGRREMPLLGAVLGAKPTPYVIVQSESSLQPCDYQYQIVRLATSQ